MVAEYLMEEIDDAFSDWVDENGTAHDSRDCPLIFGSVARSEGALTTCGCEDRRAPDHARHSRDRFRKVTTAKKLEEQRGVQHRDMAKRYQKQNTPKPEPKRTRSDRQIAPVAVSEVPEPQEDTEEISDLEILKQAALLACRLFGRLAVIIFFAVTKAVQTVWRSKPVRKQRRKLRAKFKKNVGPVGLVVIVAVIVAAIAERGI